MFGLMHLLGGRRPDPNTIRLPFTLEGMLTGMLYVAPNGYDRGLTDPARLVGVPLLVAMLATSGLLLGAFGSGITLRRFPRT